MRCEACEYNQKICYEDSTCECILLPEDEWTENSKGEEGCRYTQKQLDKKYEYAIKDLDKLFGSGF